MKDTYIRGIYINKCIEKIGKYGGGAGQIFYLNVHISSRSWMFIQNCRKTHRSNLKPFSEIFFDKKKENKNTRKSMSIKSLRWLEGKY